MMKKKSKKLLLWLFVLTFVLTGIAGCGTKQKDDQEAASTETAGAISSVDDIVGKKIGVQLGTTGDIYVSDYENDGSGTTVERYNKGADAVQALKQGKIDCVVIDEQPALAFVEENPGLKILDEEFTLEEYAIVIAKGNDDLLEKVNTALEELRSEGTLDRITKNYIGTDAEKGNYPYEPQDVSRGNGTLTMGTNAEFPPYEYYEKYKIRRYGFHGTSHSYVSRKAADVLDKKYEDLKIIVCHLGNGASVSAVKNGKCVDTSMGLTPLEGLIMGTRSGDIDPAIMEFIAHKEGKNIDEIMTVLNKKSGVYGLSNNLSSDFRDLEDGYNRGDEHCIRTMKTYCYRVAKYIGSYVAAMNGVDVICFTAGIGENAPLVRSLVCEHLGFLGVSIDEDANHKRGEEIAISTPDSKTTVMVIPTNEELAIARETVSLVK